MSKSPKFRIPGPRISAGVALDPLSGRHLLVDCLIEPNISKVLGPRSLADARTGTPTSRPHSVKALVDSGADCSLINKQLAQTLNLKPVPLDTPLLIEAVNGETLNTDKLYSYCLLTFSIQNKSFSHCFYILTNSHIPIIFGIDWLIDVNPVIHWPTLTLKFVKDDSIYVHPPSICNISGVRPSRSLLTASSQIYERPNDNPAEDDHFEDKNPVPEELTKTIPLNYLPYKSVFLKEQSELLPEHRKVDMKIDIIDGKTPPWGPIYPLAQPEMKALKNYIDDNLRKGYIRPSTSSAGAPIFFVKKKNGELRPVIDYRGLNEVTVKNRYPLPLMNDLLTRFNTARIFTKIDLRGAYNLVRIHEGDEWKTAFRCRYGHYEYMVMPFGLTNAPAVFQGLMNDIFYDLLDTSCIVYLDDILVYSPDLQTHIQDVTMVLQRLKDNKLYAKLEKCKFHVERTDFLGYIISSTGVEMDPNRVKNVMDWPTPKNLKQLQSFLGFTNFYRMFIPAYTETTKPLLMLLKKDTPYHWTSECESSFRNLKNSFLQGGVLIHADSNKPFIVEADASDFAVGGILSQEYDGEWRPIAFYSRKLTAPEVNYEIHDKELLSIIVCFYQWRSFLLSTSEPIQVFTDHRNLLYYTSSKRLNRRQARWATYLADFNYIINYRAGKDGVKPDALSRRPDYVIMDGEDRDQLQNQILIDPKRIKINTSYVIQPDMLQRIITDQANDVSVIESKNKDVKKINNIYYFRDKIYTPKSLIPEVLQTFHDFLLVGHPGIRKTTELISRYFYWPKM
jgi:hypothetical protein